MKKFWSHKELPYIIAVIIIGSLCHFVYEWSGESSLAALFCPVNESTWEHLKLLFFPYLAVITYMYFTKDPQKKPALFRYYCSRLFGVLLGMLSIIVIFYTYTGVIGENYLIADILTFIISVFISFYTSSVFYYRCNICKEASSLIFAGWLLITLLFFIFTCYTPDLPLFYSPV